MINLDLHTHSIASPDGSLNERHYRRYFDQRLLDVIAITDHNRIDYALKLAETFGQHVIVGEEIMTSQGELVGLYLTKPVAPQQTAAATVAAIKAQGGLVYVPHPFETRRHSLSRETLDSIIKDVDIIETHNGRAWTDNSPVIIEYAALYAKPQAASSDAHSPSGLGKTHMQVANWPTPQTLSKLVDDAHLTHSRPPLSAHLAPSFNRLRHALHLIKHV